MDSGGVRMARAIMRFFHGEAPHHMSSQSVVHDENRAHPLSADPAAISRKSVSAHVREAGNGPWYVGPRRNPVAGKLIPWAARGTVGEW